MSNKNFENQDQIIPSNSFIEESKVNSDYDDQNDKVFDNEYYDVASTCRLRNLRNFQLNESLPFSDAETDDSKMSDKKRDEETANEADKAQIAIKIPEIKFSAESVNGQKGNKVLPNLHNLERSMNLNNFKLSPNDFKLDFGSSMNSYNYANSNDNLDASQDDLAKSGSLLNHPKYAQYFRKRTCTKFVADSKTKLCVGCQLKVNEGSHVYTGTEWNYKTCTKLNATDAYGKLSFPGSHSKTASYIRVEIETNTKDMIQYLYSQEGWNLQRPQLILSVTGGAQKFTIPHRMKKAFKRGLIKAAASTGAWIITGGTNTGVMRLVGEAVADEFHTCNLTVLGIATWGKIAFREQMIKKNSKNDAVTTSFNEITKEAQQVRENGTIYKKEPLFYAQQQENELSENKKEMPKNTDVLLDPNHTHFILVDDGSEGQFGKEIEFRAHLEAELRKGKSLKYYEKKRNQRKKVSSRSSSSGAGGAAGGGGGGGGGGSGNQNLMSQSDDDEDEQDEDNIRNETVPMILIVVQGGPNTLLTVEQSLKQNVPVLVLADSKGCADLIANACAAVKPEKSNLEKLIVESKMYERIKDPEVYKKEMSEALRRLEYIISKLEDNLINVFRLDSEEGGSDIELTILRAFLNSRKNQYYENLKLALQWNRSDIAKTDIFTGEEEFKSYQLANLMEMALIQNKPQFVELLLENGLNLKSFLTVRRLCFLYNSHKIQSDAKKAPLFQLYKKKYSSDHAASLITFKGLLKFLKDYLFEDFEPSFLPDDLDLTFMEKFLHVANKKEGSDVDIKDDNPESNNDKKNKEVLYPEQNLFLWALFLNRIDIATLFWQIGEHQISSALFASNLLKSMAGRLSDLEKELNNHANNFEEMAIGVLNIFDSTTDDIINGVILLRKIPFYNLDCLQMAVEADCKKFVSLSSVQNLLTDIWYGKIVSKSGMKASIRFAISCMSFGLLAPFLIFDRREKLTNLSDRENTLKKLATYNKKKNITIFNFSLFGNTRTNLLREYLTNYEINMDKKEANLLPNFCTSDDTSSSSSSENDDSDNDESRTDAADEFILEASNSPRVKRSKSKSKKKQSKWTTYWNRYKRFVHSPRVHFVYDALFYFIFLILFSYMILCEFNYYEQVGEHVLKIPHNETTTASSNKQDFNFSHELNSANESFVEKESSTVLKKPSLIEYVLIYWMISFALEEFRQYFFGESETKILKNKLLHYFANNWNYLDISGCLVFSIGMSLRFISMSTDENLFIAARIILCIDLCIWYLRLLHVSIVFKSLGPKLVMIQKMVRDLMFFISIIAIFVCVFGVTTQATLYPGNKLDLHLLRNVLNKAYWPIYGEMKILDELDDCVPDLNKNVTCPQASGVAFSFIALMIYMVIANVLLINLLIAMFSSTFQDVQENTDKIWKFQRYRLVFEYYDSPILPPPLNFIAYVVALIRYLKRKRNEKYSMVKKSGIGKLANNEELVENRTKDDVDLLLDRERKFAEEYLRMENFRFRETTDSRLKWTNEKLETLEQKLNEVIETRFKESNQLCDAINWIMANLEDRQNKPQQPPYIQNIKSNRKHK